MTLTLREVINGGLLDELAACFGDETDAYLLLGAIDFPPARRPNFRQLATPQAFWMTVCEQIANGLVANGFEGLLSRAASNFPANPTFAPYARPAPAATHEPHSGEVALTPPKSLPDPADARTVRALKIFLSHASEDKPVVRDLYQRLLTDGFDPWLDEVEFLPGDDIRLKIEQAVHAADAVIVCLSETSLRKPGWVQREIRLAQEVAIGQPPGAIFLIPVKLGACEVPWDLRTLNWLDYYGDRGAAYNLLRRSLDERAAQLGIV